MEITVWQRCVVCQELRHELVLKFEAFQPSAEIELGIVDEICPSNHNMKSDSYINMKWYSMKFCNLLLGKNGYYT